MVDIKNKPYFSYNEILESLTEPLRNAADIKFMGHGRLFPDRSRFLIASERDWAIDFFTISKLYRYGIYERNPQDIPSKFDMWDHLPYAPPEIYVGCKEKFGIAHGLTIIQQFGDYCDSFVFATTPQNSQINNFYLNQKELFSIFMKNFYKTMDKTLQILKPHTFMVPPDLAIINNPLHGLSMRQKECSHLLIEGHTTKEIAKILDLSPRTIETHLDILKDKMKAKNRPQLVHLLRNVL